MMKKLYMVFVLAFALNSIYAQSITGTVMDKDSGEPLIGVSIQVKGTTTGTVTDLDGNFSITNPLSKAGYLEISYLGYQTMLADISAGDQDLGSLSLSQGFEGLEEIVVTGVMDIVRDRRTPVAVSTITTAEIRAKAGNVEFPELMKNTPSIYVANQSGGYGDSEVFTRGFDQTNTAFLLNGQPINGMEDGKMYWSNWSGMSDVANAIQIQRGLGSSKLAISSVGGTTNIIMKSTAQNQGGSASLLYGNDNYIKSTVSYNTGLINDKFGMTFLLTHWQGDGWAEGTKGQGQNYFISAGYKASDRNSFNFLITGAPQWHDQNFTKSISSHYNDPSNPDEINLKYNGNWGEFSSAKGEFAEGDYFSLRRNYYHKPVSNLNWEFAINETSSLSTVLYASWGRGGGSGNIGSSSNRAFTDEGQLDWATIFQNNADDAGSSEYVIRNSVNNHSWYGLVSTYENQISENVSFSLGADLRKYRGSHFRELRNLMGAPSYTQRENARFGEREVTNAFDANPWSAVNGYAKDLVDRIAYNNDETITYYGTFGQLEYNVDKFSAFVQGAVSNQSHVRIELFNEPEANEDSETVTNGGYNVKTGFSYAIDKNSTFFANTGYYSRQPFHDDIYLNFSNTVNPVTVPEKIFGLEAGYKYSNKDFSANLNVYRTAWDDRATTRSLNIGDALPAGAGVPGDTLTTDAFRNSLQNQLHQGVELDFGYKLTNELKIKGYASVGDWKYDGTLDTKYYTDNDARTLIYEESGIEVDTVHVGGAAQTSFGLGLDYRMSNGLSFDLDYNYYSRLYSNISASTTVLELPSFGLVDFGVSYNFNLNSGQLITLRANVFNVLGEEYISRAFSANAPDSEESENWNGVNKSNRVSFGKTRTWNVSAKYHF